MERLEHRVRREEREIPASWVFPAPSERRVLQDSRGCRARQEKADLPACLDQWDQSDSPGPQDPPVVVELDLMTWRVPVGSSTDFLALEDLREVRSVFM
ncbi:hypothetical protein CRUP_009789 [Coryphaenoides rupestris]|nr:hypothetical protein CRUP_009789 [Coryphaenoides rupestris]